MTVLESDQENYFYHPKGNNCPKYKTWPFDNKKIYEMITNCLTDVNV